MGEKAGTQIQDLMNDINGNKLSSEENSMVDSIINDLNTGKPQQTVPSQQKMPQLTDEEKQMLMKQQDQWLKRDGLPLTVPCATGVKHSHWDHF